MLDVFFIDKFGRDGAVNNRWIDFLEEKEDELTPGIRLAFSKILNNHHIWNSRLRSILPESELTDVLPLSHWKHLQQANSRETLSFLADFSAEEKINYHASEDVKLERLSADLLFQLLQDSQFYRGQMALLCEQQGLGSADTTFVVMD